MDSNHETGNSTRSVAGATRMPSDATDDDEVRERGVVPTKRFHCGQPNPVYTADRHNMRFICACPYSCTQ